VAPFSGRKSRCASARANRIDACTDGRAEAIAFALLVAGAVAARRDVPIEDFAATPDLGEPCTGAAHANGIDASRGSFGPVVEGPLLDVFEQRPDVGVLDQHLQLDLAAPLGRAHENF
jgi:hypothetical protein